MAKEAPPNPPNEREKAPPRPSPSLGKGNRARGESSQALPAAGPAELQDSRLRETGRVVLDAARIHRALMRIAHEIVESSADGQELYLVAIPNGGVPLGRALATNLADLLGLEVPMGILDTTLYRDDLGTRGTRPRLRRTEMPSSVDERVVIL
ncbi:MAG: phosphoribosyltransferase family protein, partial [Myxococcota bacterium]|nr:phosphoribosyltransferase family protein [Myxococcota bacterium]